MTSHVSNKFLTHDKNYIERLKLYFISLKTMNQILVWDCNNQNNHML